MHSFPFNVIRTQLSGLMLGFTAKQTNLGLTLALILAFSPEEKEPPWLAFVFSTTIRSIPLPDLPPTRGT
jgi:hypothetical protein